MPGESKTSPRRIKAVQRQKQALTLRLSGASFEQIAVALGYASKAGAYMSVMAGLAKVPEPEAKAYRKLNLERLNRGRLGYWRNLEKGDPRSVELEIKTQERETRYLGLDAPIRAEITGKDGGPVLISLAELALMVAQKQREESRDDNAGTSLPDPG